MRTSRESVGESADARYAQDGETRQFLLLFNYWHPSVTNIMKPSMQTSELLSALADGHLRGDEFAHALRACQDDESALSHWNTYHLIGDVLRSPESALPASGSSASLAFLDRLNQRLALETGAPEVFTERAPVDAADLPLAATRHRQEAANDAGFRWKLVAGLASLAAVSAIAWNASGLFGPAPSAQLAQTAPAPLVVASPQGPMVRDARLEELLAAHRQLGAATALQEPSGFLRNAAFDLSQDARR